MKISPEEAAAALNEIEASRVAMWKALRSHRGHLYLCLWGFIWMATAALNWADGRRFQWVNIGLSVAGSVATIVIAWAQSREIRSKVDKRFIAACATLLAFGYVVWPIVFGGFRTVREGYAFGILLWMQVYIIGGIWFDIRFLFWIGIAVTLIVLAAFLFFPAAFWWLVFFGAAIIFGSGIYTRFFRRPVHRVGR